MPSPHNYWATNLIAALCFNLGSNQVMLLKYSYKTEIQKATSKSETCKLGEGQMKEETDEVKNTQIVHI